MSLAFCQVILRKSMYNLSKHKGREPACRLSPWTVIDIPAQSTSGTPVVSRDISRGRGDSRHRHRL